MKQKAKSASSVEKEKAESELLFGRKVLIAGLIIYPLWWKIARKSTFNPLDPLGDYDPFIGRVYVSILAATLLTLTYVVKWFRDRTPWVHVFYSSILTLHYFHVVRASELMPFRVVGSFIVITPIAASFTKQKYLATYAVVTLMGSIWASTVAHPKFPPGIPPQAHATLLLIAFITVRAREQLATALESSRQKIKELFDSLGEGYFTFDSSGVIASEATRVASTLFETNVPGQPYMDVLRGSDNERASFVSWLEAVFVQGVSFEAARALLPVEYQTPGGSWLSLSYRPIYRKEKGEARKLDRVVVIAQDTTQKRALEMQVAQQQDRMTAIVKVLENRRGFAYFVRDAKITFSSLLDLSAKAMGLMGKEFEKILQRLHTMKGMAGAFHLLDWTHQIHELETKIGRSGEKGAPKELTATALKELSPEVSAVQSRLDGFLQDNEKLIGKFDGNQEATGSLTERQKNELVASLQLELSSESVALRQVKRIFFSEKISDRIREFQSSVDELAHELNKKIRFEVQAGEFSVARGSWDHWFGALIHCIRNSVDHGVELPRVRLEKGKPEEGIISVRFEELSGKGIRLIVEDDGQGIQTQKVLQKAISAGLVTAEEASRLNEDEINRFIFRAGFSTQEQVSEISGRGVGMDAVLTETQNLGGTITVQNKPSAGMVIKFDFPNFETF